MGDGERKPVCQIENIAQRGEHQHIAIEEQHAIEPGLGETFKLHPRMRGWNGVHLIKDGVSRIVQKIGEDVDRQAWICVPQRLRSLLRQIKIARASGHKDHTIARICLAGHRHTLRPRAPLGQPS